MFQEDYIINNKTWINELFSNLTDGYNGSIYFEEKSKLVGKNLNLSIHPIRFLDDVFFSFETEDLDLRNRLKKYEVNYNTFYSYANIIKSSCIKSKKVNNIQTNSILIVGQTEKDKVIFNGLRYVSLFDYMEDIKRITNCYDNIYFKPHPYARNNRKIINKLKKEFKNLNVIYDNIYHVLANDNIKHVMGLNSSVLYEAKYFNKKTTFLYGPYFDFDNRDIGIYGDYFSSSFWADILEIEDGALELPFSPNRLRKVVNDFWGYTEVSDEIVIKNIIKNKFKYIFFRFF